MAKYYDPRNVFESACRENIARIVSHYNINKANYAILTQICGNAIIGRVSICFTDYLYLCFLSVNGVFLHLCTVASKQSVYV